MMTTDIAIVQIKTFLPIDRSKLPEDALPAFETLDQLTEGFTDFSDIKAFPEFEELTIEFAEFLKKNERERMLKLQESKAKKPAKKSSTSTSKKKAIPKKEVPKNTANAKPKILLDLLITQIQLLKTL